METNFGLAEQLKQQISLLYGLNLLSMVKKMESILLLCLSETEKQWRLTQELLLAIVEASSGFMALIMATSVSKIIKFLLKICWIECQESTKMEISELLNKILTKDMDFIWVLCLWEGPL